MKGDVDFNYDISVDTAFYKVKAFQTTIGGDHELFGTIINDYQAGIAKVAIIDFGINNSADLTTDNYTSRYRVKIRIFGDYE